MKKRPAEEVILAELGLTEVKMTNTQVWLNQLEARAQTLNSWFDHKRTKIFERSTVHHFSGSTFMMPIYGEKSNLQWLVENGVTCSFTVCWMRLRARRGSLAPSRSTSPLCAGRRSFSHTAVIRTASQSLRQSQVLATQL